MVEWKKLGEVCDILNGFAFKSQEYVSEGIRIIRISDVQSGCISDKDKVFYPVEKVSEFERYLLHQGDLVMSLTGNPGRIAIIKDDSCALNQRVACLRANDVSRSFLFYLFNCKEFESIAFANSTGGAQKNLSTAWLNNYRILIPSLSEQQRIVSILDTFTSSISNLKQQIEERRKQYEYERDLLLDLEGKEGVEMKKLGEVFSFKNGLNKGKEFFGKGKPIIMFTNVFNSRFITKAMIKSRVDISEQELERINAQIGDVFFTRTSETKEDVGYASVLVEDMEECTFAGFLIRARPITHKMLPQYCKYCFSTPKVRNAIVSKSSFTTRASLTGSGLGEVIIPLPPLSTQSRIVSILDTFEQSIANLEEQLAMREKQYEYYRNQLLTFEGKEERGKT